MVSVPDWDWLVPTCTFPKLTLAVPAVRVPSSVFWVLWILDLLVLSPWQPSIVARASRAGIAIQRLGGAVISG